MSPDSCCFFFSFFFFNDTATTEIYTLSLHDALPIWRHSDANDIGGEYREEDFRRVRGNQEPVRRGVDAGDRADRSPLRPGRLREDKGSRGHCDQAQAALTSQFPTPSQRSEALRYRSKGRTPCPPRAGYRRGCARHAARRKTPS